MGKSTPRTPPMVQAPPPPPTKPVEAVGDDTQTPTKVALERQRQQEGVVFDSPQGKGTVLDTEDADRKVERELARKKSRSNTRVTGRAGLLDEAPVIKKGLLS